MPVQFDRDTPILSGMIVELGRARDEAEGQAAALAQHLADIEALHEPDGNGDCPTCGTASPCLTHLLIRREISIDQAYAAIRDHQPIDLTAAESRQGPPVPSLADLLAAPSADSAQLLDSTLATMGWVVSNHLIVGQEPAPMGNDNFTAAPSGAFQTGDGLINIAANKQEQFVALMKLIEREDLVEDPRFAHREDRKRNRAALTIEVEAGLASRPAAEWEGLLNEAGVPAGRVLTVPAALGLEQVQGRALVERFDDFDVLGKPLSLVTAGYKLSDGKRRLHAPPPRLGEHTDEILGEVGYSADEVTQLREASAI